MSKQDVYMHSLVMLTLMCVYANAHKSRVQAQPTADLCGSWSMVGRRCAVVTPRYLLSNNPRMIGQPLSVNMTTSPPLCESPTPIQSPFCFFCPH